MENPTHAQTVVTRLLFGPGYEANSSYMYYLTYEEQKCTCGASYQLTCSAFSSGCTTSPLVVVSLWPSSTCIPLWTLKLLLLDFYTSEHFVLYIAIGQPTHSCYTYYRTYDETIPSTLLHSYTSDSQILWKSKTTSNSTSNSTSIESTFSFNKSNTNSN